MKNIEFLRTIISLLLDHCYLNTFVLMLSNAVFNILRIVQIDINHVQHQKKNITSLSFCSTSPAHCSHLQVQGHPQISVSGSGWEEQLQLAQERIFIMKLSLVSPFWPWFLPASPFQPVFPVLFLLLPWIICQKSLG